MENGDLPKLKHIINGILDLGKDSEEQETALIFHQFGKHLANSNEEPIIDQHVLRAFAIHYNLKNTPKEQKELIAKYKKWLTSSHIKQELRQEKDYMYYIDQILFATGKAIKNVKAENI